MSEECIISIFKNLDMCTDKTSDYTAVEDFLSSRVANFASSLDLSMKPCALPFNEREHVLKCFVDLLQKKKKELIALLHLTVYNENDSEDIIMMLIKEFIYYFNVTFVLDKWCLEQDRCDVSTCELVQLQISSAELPIVGRLLAPPLFLGYSICVRILNTDHKAFFIYLRDILHEAGAPAGMLFLMDNTTSECQNPSVRRNIASVVDDRYNVMLIFQDADLSSALECAMSASLQFEGKAFFSLSHVYVQEAVYDKFVTLLESLVKNENATKIYLEGAVHKKKDTPLIKEEFTFDLKILKLSENHPHCVYVGWDPRDINNDMKYELSLTILPFKTREEVISLVNKSKYACTASIWTESISIANYVFLNIDINLVWVNSHGLFDPAVPVEPQKHNRIIMNGPTLASYLDEVNLVRFAHVNKNTSVNDSWERLLMKIGLFKDVPDWKPMFLRENIQISMDMAQKGVKFLQNYDNKLFVAFKKMNLSQSDSPVIKLFSSLPVWNILELIYKFSQLQDYTSYLTLENIVVCKMYIPLGVVWIILDEAYDSIFEDFLILLYSLIVRGNSVIVTSYIEDFMKKIFLTFSLFTEIFELPKGVFNYVDAPLREFYPPTNNEDFNENARLTGRYIFLNKTHRRNWFNNELDKSVFKQFRNVDFNDNIHSLMSKVLWSPSI